MEASAARAVEVRSADGTALAAEIRGQGSPIVLVHGTGVDKGDWLELPGLLAEQHTVWSYDRRGRGRSADGSDWTLEREVDDIRAVLSAVDGPAHLLTHSFGAVCALEAVAVGVSPRSLVLYEPPVHVARVSDAVERSVARFEEGDPDGALAIFFVEVAGMPRDELESFRSMPEWNSALERAPTIAREIQALARLVWQPGRFRSVTVPVLQISGGATEGPVYPTHEEISEALPHALHVTIPGEGHVAFVHGPEAFARVILEFTLPFDGRADGVNA